MTGADFLLLAGWGWWPVWVLAGVGVVALAVVVLRAEVGSTEAAARWRADAVDACAAAAGVVRVVEAEAARPPGSAETRWPRSEHACRVVAARLDDLRRGAARPEDREGIDHLVSAVTLLRRSLETSAEIRDEPSGTAGSPGMVPAPVRTRLVTLANAARSWRAAL